MITEWAAHQDTIQKPYIVQQNGSSLSTTQEKQSVQVQIQILAADRSCANGQLWESPTMRSLGSRQRHQQYGMERFHRSFQLLSDSRAKTLQMTTDMHTDTHTHTPNTQW